MIFPLARRRYPFGTPSCGTRTNWCQVSFGLPGCGGLSLTSFAIGRAFGGRLPGAATPESLDEQSFGDRRTSGPSETTAIVRGGCYHKGRIRARPPVGSFFSA